MNNLTTLESDTDSLCVKSVGHALAARSIGLGFLSVHYDIERDCYFSADEESQQLICNNQWQAVLSSKRNEWKQSSFRAGTGVTVYPIPINRRGRDIGYCLLHRFDETITKNALFVGALSDVIAFGAMQSFVEHECHGLDSVLVLLRGTVEDLAARYESENDIEDLSHRLGEAYETLELLYALGRSMKNIDKPDRFVVQVCSRIRNTLGFGYVAMHVGRDANILSASTVWEGDSDAGPETLGARDRLLRAIKLNAPLGEWKDSLGSVVRVLPTEYGTDAIIVAGDKQVDGGHISSYDTKLIEAAASFTSTFLSNARLLDQQKKLFVGIVESLSAAIDAKDTYTEGHSRRVAHLGQQIALHLGMTRAESERVRIAGLLHDVGKIGVPETVLCKAGKLTDEEYGFIKMHPEIGHRILKDLSGLEDVLPAVLHHHERYDGRGYPYGLAGDSIPLMARILACADTFDAMSSTRSYRAAMPRDKVLAEIENCRGSQFDTNVVSAFMQINLSIYDEMVAKEAANALRAA